MKAETAGKASTKLYDVPLSVSRHAICHHIYLGGWAEIFGRQEDVFSASR